MADTWRERYAVVSCHVERPLDDAVWTRFASLQTKRPGGFAVAALIRPPDISAGEDEARWIERARAAAALGPLGHHTHWTAPDHARPTGDRTGERVLTEGRWLREQGLAPTLFCGGGWYADADVAEACAELGYVDCTPRASRPPYLTSGEAWAWLDGPARVRLPSGEDVLALPTTHSVGDLARALFSRHPLPAVTHVYFHDTDLLVRSRRALIPRLLALLARQSESSDLAELSRTLGAVAPRVDWADVVRS